MKPTKDKSQSTNLLEPLIETRKLEIRTQSKNVKFPATGKKYVSPVRTVPNMALSVNEILQRYSRGQSIPKSKEPIFTETDYSQLDRLDTIEKVDLLHSTKNYIKETQQNLQNPLKTNEKQPEAGTASSEKGSSEPASE